MRACRDPPGVAVDGEGRATATSYWGAGGNTLCDDIVADARLFDCLPRAKSPSLSPGVPVPGVIYPPDGLREHGSRPQMSSRWIAPDRAIRKAEYVLVHAHHLPGAGCTGAGRDHRMVVARQVALRRWMLPLKVAGRTVPGPCAPFCSWLWEQRVVSTIG